MPKEAREMPQKSTTPILPKVGGEESDREATERQGRGSGLRGRAWLAGVGALALGLAALAHASPAWIEAWYVPGIGTWVPLALGRASAHVPFALPDLLVPLFFLTLGLPLGAALVRLARGGKREPGAATLGRAALTTLALGLVVAATFQWAWGVHYGRPRIAARWGFPSEDTPIAVDPHQLAASLTARTNALYLELHGSYDLGRPSSPGSAEAPFTDPDLGAALERAYARLAARVDRPDFAIRRPDAKPTRMSPLLQRLGISGFYFPWTGEACYVAEAPWASRVQTVAHEKAHQRGVAREDEANFVGALACLLADEAYVRYGGYFFLHRQALREVAALGMGLDAAFLALLKQRRPGVQRDVDDVAAFWSRTEGRLRGLGRAVNDAYLKAHGTEGVVAYRKSASLIARFSATARGRELLFGEAPQRGSDD